MTPVTQQFRHNPPKTYGDCHRASMASLLDLPLYAVPHFMEGLGISPQEAEIFNSREKSWLNSLGLIAITIPCADELTKVLQATLIWAPSQNYFLLGGKSKTGCGHTVVASCEGIVWDPSIDKSGIVGPMDDGCYWVTFIVRPR